MPLKLISNFVSSFLKRADQPLVSSPSISFSPSIVWKKEESSNSISSAESERWVAHQEQLSYWQNQQPIFDNKPNTTIDDYTLTETLGNNNNKRVNYGLWFMVY
jgi:protein kinase X